LPAVSIVFLRHLCDCCQTFSKFARDRDMIKRHFWKADMFNAD
jgi:hypothetical protein